MEHLPQISNPSKLMLKVPFLLEDRFNYEYNGLRDYPNRCQLVIGASNRKSENLESSAFFQSWLFFGTLAEVLAPYRIPVVPDDFLNIVDGSNMLTTARLRGYIAAWVICASYEGPWCLETGPPSNASYDQEIGTSPHRETKQKAEQILSVLESVSSILKELVPYRSAINAGVWDAVLILYCTLRRSARFLYRAYRVDFAATDSLSSLPSLFLSECWEKGQWSCPREKSIIRHLVDGDISVLLLCAQLDRRQEEVSHSTCNDSLCSAYQIDEQSYRTRHTVKSCTCNFIDVGKIYSEAISTQKFSWTSGKLSKIPAITYAYGSIDIVYVSLSVARINRATSGKIGSESAFVAFSHVWAHGRGNPRSNALPRCQIELLQRLSNRLYPERSQLIPFWIDTLCVLLDPTYRKNSLHSMERIYKSAPRVLVLDNALMQIQTARLTTEEIGLQIMCSAWPRRLWTLQEGMFQSSVHYQFRDGVYTFESLNRSVRRQHCFPWQEIPFPANHFLYKLLESPPSLDRKSTQVFHTEPPLQQHAHKALTCWPIISSFFKDMNVLYHWEGVNNNTYLAKVIRGMMTRTTSKTEDEGLVFTSFATIRTSSDAAKGNVAAEDRIRKVLQPTFGYGMVPSNIIFLDQRRYEEEGCRWIPKSFLSQESPSALLLPELEEGYGAMARPDGLHIKSLGLILHFTESQSSHSPFPISTFPSIPQYFILRFDDQTYQAHVCEAGTRDFPKDLITQSLTCGVTHPTLILQDSFNLKGPSAIAVLVDIIDWDNVQAILLSLDQKEVHPKNSTRKKVQAKLSAFMTKLDKNLHPIKIRHKALVHLTGLSDDERRRSSLPFVSSQPVAADQKRDPNAVWKSQRWFLV